MEAPIFMTPGEQIKTFEVYSKVSMTSSYGKILKGDSVKSGKIYGTISESDQREKEEWNRLNHPISHTIVVHGACSVKAEDILLSEEKREFIVQGVENPAGMGIFYIIYCLHKSGSEVLDHEG